VPPGRLRRRRPSHPAGPESTCGRSRPGRSLQPSGRESVQQWLSARPLEKLWGAGRLAPPRPIVRTVQSRSRPLSPPELRRVHRGSHPAGLGCLPPEGHLVV